MTACSSLRPGNGSMSVLLLAILPISASKSEKKSENPGIWRLLGIFDIPFGI